MASDSQEELPPRKRQKRHDFKGFSRRLAEVNVGVYADRRLRQAAPAHGTSSFIQEELHKWRELNCAADFNELAAALNPLVLSMPSVLHQQEAISAMLLDKLTMQAVLSLEAIVHLIGGLARDLQADFMPKFPQLCSRLADLISAGCDRLPEALQHIFTGLGLVIKALAKRLAAAAPAMLKCSRRLRFHPVEHVRTMAASAFAFPLRHASLKQLRRAVPAILAEHAKLPCEERVHGCGQLLAEAARGPSDLHSQAAHVLKLALSEVSGGNAQAASTEAGQGTGKVLAVMTAQLLDHIRRGKGDVLFASILTAAQTTLDALDSTSGSLEQIYAAAEMLALVTQTITYFNGSRINDYAPFFAIAQHVCTKLDAMKAGLAVGLHDEATAQLASQALSMLLSLVHSHAKGNQGAAQGLGPVAALIPSILSALAQAPLDDAIAFCHRAMDPFGYGVHAGVAAALAEPLVAGLSRGVMSGDAAQQGACLTALAHLLSANENQARQSAALRHNEQLCMTIKRAACDISTSDNTALAWAALQCLPHVCSTAEDVMDTLDTATASQAAHQSSQALFLGCSAAKLKLQLLLTQWRTPSRPAPAQLQAVAQQALDRVLLQSTDYHALAVAAEALESAQHEPLSSQCRDLAAALQDNLFAPSQPLRLVSLRLMVCLSKQADYQTQQPPDADAPEDAGHALRDVYGHWRAIEGQSCTLENGRTAVVAIGRMQAALEFGQVPSHLVGPLVRCLLGALHIRFAVLWEPCSKALAMALAHQPDIAWPLVLHALQHTQADLLSGHNILSASLPDEDEQRPGALPRTAEQWFEGARAAGSIAAGGGCTDSAVRLNNLLKALAGTPAGGLERMSHDWVPLFLHFAAARNTAAEDDGPAADAAEAPAQPDAMLDDRFQLGARVWREQLKVWLAFVGGIKGPQRLAQSPLVRRSLAGLLTDLDAGVQQGALTCLKAYKIPYLASTYEGLVQLTKDVGLRDALLSFPFSPDSDASPSVEHRPGLMNVAIRLLWPRMRRRSGRFAGHGAPGSSRAAILNALTALLPEELAPLLLLNVQPLSNAIQPPAGAVDNAMKTSDHDRLFVEPWWVQHLGQHDCAWWLHAINLPAVTAGVPTRTGAGFVNAAADLLQHLGALLQPHLPLLASLALRLLQSSLPSAAPQDEDGRQQGARKDLATACVRLLASMWLDFPDSIAYDALWQPFFAAVAELKGTLQMSAESVPALLEVVVALAASPTLAEVLAPAPPPAQANELNPAARLLQDVLRGLAAGKCSAAARDAALAAVESLLDHGSPLTERVLAPHALLLASSLREVIQLTSNAPSDSKKRLKAGKQAVKKEASGRTTALRALAILERMGEGLLQGEAAAALAAALLPLLEQAHGPKPKRIDEPVVTRILAALSAAWTALAASGKEVSDTVAKAAAALAPLFGSLTERSCRAAACRAYTALGRLQPQLAPPAALLHSLDTWSTSQLDEPDYDQRLAAYRQLQAGAWRSFPHAGACALLHRCLRDLREASDLPLRHAASQALGHFVSSLTNTDADADADAVAEAGSMPLSQEDAMKLVWKVVYPAVKSNLAAPNLAVRQEHVLLLRALIQAAPGSFTQLRCLVDADTEICFFHNIAHLQIHRRSRALARLSRALKQGQLGPSTILGVVAPLLQQALAGARGLEGGPHKRKGAADGEKARGQDAALAESAIATLQAAAAALGWHPYRQLLGRFLRLLAHQREGSDGPSVRALCAIVDAFHFTPHSPHLDPPHPQQPALHLGSAAAQQTTDLTPQPAAAAAAEAHTDSLSAAQAEQAEDGGEEVTKTLQLRVVPALEKVMKARHGEVVRAPVALALVKLVKHLPEPAARALLPRTLQGVANLLRSRLQRIRDDARGVLVAMAVDLGAAYLPFVVQVLQSALPSRGYTAHVLGFTLHSVLDAVAQVHGQHGLLDESAEGVLAVLEGQVFGEVAEEKEVAAVTGGVREAKQARSYATFGLLVKCTTLSSHLSLILRLVQQHLHEAGQPKLRAKLELLLSHAAKGVGDNASATAEDVLVFVHSALAADARTEQAAKRRLGSSDDSAAPGLAAAEAGEEQWQWLLTVMALSVLHKGLRKGKLREQLPERLAMLDGILPLLAAALKSRQPPVASLALRCLAILLTLPLPGLAKVAPEAGGNALQLLRRAQFPHDPLAQEAFKLVAAFLRTCPTYQPSIPQLRFLVQWGLGELEEAAPHLGAFALLRALLARRIVLPEVYDVMGRIQQLMVRTQAAPMRDLCSSVVLQFTLDYPLGSRRLQQHLHFLLANLGFQHAGGRLAVAATLRALSAKLPAPLVDTWAPVFFLPLVAQLVNEDDGGCRGEIAAALQVLFQRASTPVADKMGGWCQEWLAGSQGAALGRAAAQAAGMQAQAEGTRFSRRVPGLLPPLLHSLATDAAAAEEGEADRRSWQSTYAALVLLEKIMTHAPSALRWSEGEVVQRTWAGVSQQVLHAHAWVRGAAARLLGLAFADAAIGERMLQAGVLRIAAASLALHLFTAFNTLEADEALRTQAAKCLVFLAPRLTFHAGMHDTAEGQDVSMPDEQPEDSESDAEDGPAAAETAEAGITLHGLVRRVSRMAGSRVAVHLPGRLAALRLMAALASVLGQAQLQGCLPLMLPPLFRADEAAASEPSEVRDLAAEVMQHLRSVAGPEAVVQAYSSARAAVLKTRSARRQSQALQAMVDPAAAAQAKVRKQVRHAGARKRKAELHSRQRSASSYTPKCSFKRE